MHSLLAGRLIDVVIMPRVLKFGSPPICLRFSQKDIFWKVSAVGGKGFEAKEHDDVHEWQENAKTCAIVVGELYQQGSDSDAGIEDDFVFVHWFIILSVQTNSPCRMPPLTTIHGENIIHQVPFGVV